MKPLVYIILLNYNGWPDTLECLQSLTNLDYPNYRVLVVDNASSDDSVNQIKKSFPDISLIANTVNLGFAGGNNIGIRYALQHGADYVFLLNNDTVVDESAVTELVRAGEADPGAGILGSLTFYYDKPQKISFAGGWINWYTGRIGHFLNPESIPEKIDFISGCALMIKRQVIEKIGLLDEDFFLYYEDTDWCRRAIRSGYRLKLVPQSKVWHKISASTGRNSPLQKYYNARNLLLFISKNSRFPQKQIFFMLYPLRFILKSIITLITERELVWSYIKGNIDFWKGALGRQPVK